MLDTGPKGEPARHRTRPALPGVFSTFSVLTTRVLTAIRTQIGKAMGLFHFEKRTAPVNDTTHSVPMVSIWTPKFWMGINMAVYGTIAAALIRDFCMEIYVRVYRLCVWFGIAALNVWRKRPSMESVKTTLEACKALVSVVNGLNSMAVPNPA
jgi:hypothetical protein